MTDTPIANIELTLYLDENGNSLLDPGEPRLGNRLTDTNGFYLFTGLIPTNYIVVIEDPASQLTGTSQTQGANPEPVDLSGGMSNTNVDFGFYPTGEVGVIGDTVWNDSGPGIAGNRIPDENLTVLGLNGATVNLFRVEQGLTNLYASTTTAMGPGGQQGYYLFTGLPFGLYIVQLDIISVAMIGPALTILTTPSSYTTALGPNNLFGGGDFGFLGAAPTAIELVSFTAGRKGEGISIEWRTALELDTLGFNIYRAEGLKGVRIQVNPLLVVGRGAAYRVWDTNIVSGTTYYYWLEEIEADYDVSEYGPVLVEATSPADLSASITVYKPGLYRIGYEAFTVSGMAIGQIDPSMIQMRVNGEEVAAFVSAASDAMEPGDVVMFYAPEGVADIEIGAASGAARMAWVYVAPVFGDGNVHVDVAREDHTLWFQATTNFIRYIVMGFESQPVWLLDITDQRHPKMFVWSGPGPGI